jgi:hypothetical protein
MHQPNTPAHRSARGFAIAAAALAVLSPACAIAADPAAAANAFTQSGNGTQGLVGLNQNAGDANNQSNITDIAFVAGGDGAALAQVIADVEQRNATAGGAPTLQNNAISGSFNNFTGVAQVNQTTGQANDQLNIVAIAFAPGAAVSPALTDVELRGVAGPAGGGSPSSAAPDSANTIDGSFNAFRGLAQVSQIAGDSNVVVNVVAIAVGTGG